MKKILSAQENEEILLPEEDIEIRYLSISKPINIKGRSGFDLVITEGPIIINLRENEKREVVKFSEIKIIFNYSVVEQNFKNKKRKSKNKVEDKKIPLFRINPGSILFLEDCDISCEKFSSSFPYKLVCFIVNTSIIKKDEKKEEINNNNNNNNLININNNFNANNNNRISIINNTYGILNRDSTKIKIRDSSNNKITAGAQNVIKIESNKVKGAYEKADNNAESEIDEDKIDINFKKLKDKKENIVIIKEKESSNNKSNNKNNENNKNNNNNNLIDLENFQNLNNNNTNNNKTANERYSKIAVLNLVSTRISNFYQAIRSDSSIFNIEKSYFNQILGKALVFINPLFLRISESLFENNIDDAVHVRYFRTENFPLESRKLIFEKNEINYNKANGIYIEGDNTHIDLDFYVLSNQISKNKFDGIFITDLSLNFLIISENKITGNNMNGININKVYQKFAACGHKLNNIFNNNSNNLVSLNRESNFENLNNSNLNFLIIKNNELIDNEGLGLFLNDAKAIVHNNNFYKNRNNGMFLSTINFLEIFGKKTSSGNFEINKQSNHNLNLQNQYNSNQNNTSTREKTASNASFFNNNFGLSIVNECTFIKNSGNGLKVYNYSDIVYVTNCTFAENFENGILIEDDPMKITNPAVSEENESSGAAYKKSSNVIENKNNNLSNNNNKDKDYNKNEDEKNLNKKNKNLKSNTESAEKNNGLIKKKVDKFKNQDFTSIHYLLEDILKKIKAMLANENISNGTLVASNFISFNLQKFLKDNVLVYDKFNYNSSLNASNLQNIFLNIIQAINQNMHLIPKDFREFNIPYVCLLHSKIDSNSKSGISLSNYFLVIEGVTILDNGEFSILITKEEYKDFYKENKGKKNTIDADIGGPWGKAKSSGLSCNCFNSNKSKSSSARKKESREANNENNKSKNLDKQHNKKNCSVF